MHNFAQKQIQPDKARSASVARPHQSKSAPLDSQHNLLQLQREVGSRAVLGTFKSQAPLSLGTQPLGATWDFSKIPLYPPQLKVGPELPSSAPLPRFPGPIQTKLEVGSIDDPFEHEADRIADQVMRIPASDAVTTSAAPQLSRKCDQFEEEEKLQKKEAGLQPTVGNAPASVHETVSSSGQPLDPESRAFFEPRFGSDLSRVRIHTDSLAAESARSVQARAYTVGHHVVFGRDRYAPHTADGRHLLAHELTHTLQQQVGLSSLQRAPDPAPARPGLEARLKVIEETGPAARARLAEIIRNGGPIPNTKDGAKVIGAAIIDVEGYQGPKEMRAINGLDGDALGQGAPVYHATSPTNRALSATQGPVTEKGGRGASILGPRRESIYSHANDAEIKIFEAIIPGLPKGAKGTIHFLTERIPKGQSVTEMEPYPACSGCIRASFETAGMAEIDLVSHAPVHPPMRTADLGESHAGAGDHEKPPTQAGKTAVKPPAPGDPAVAEPPHVKGAGAAKPGAESGVEPEGHSKPRPNIAEDVPRSIGGRFGRTMGEIGGNLIADLIISLLVAKYQQWLNDRKLRERLLALQPAIDVQKLMVLSKFLKDPSFTGTSGFYYNIILRITSTSTTAIGGGRAIVIPGSPRPELIQVTISHDNPQGLISEDEGVKVFGIKQGATGGVYQSSITQLVVYSEELR